MLSKNRFLATGTYYVCDRINEFLENWFFFLTLLTNSFVHICQINYTTSNPSHALLCWDCVQLVSESSFTIVSTCRRMFTLPISTLLFTLLSSVSIVSVVVLHACFPKFVIQSIKHWDFGVFLSLVQEFYRVIWWDVKSNELDRSL